MNIVDFFKGMFNKFIKAFKLFLEAAIPVSRQIIVGRLKNFAIDVIKELDSTNLNNKDRQAEAFKRIKEYAKREGIEARDSLVNWIIDTGVLIFRKEF